MISIILVLSQEAKNKVYDTVGEACSCLINPSDHETQFYAEDKMTASALQIRDAIMSASYWKITYGTIQTTAGLCLLIRKWHHPPKKHKAKKNREF